MAREECPPSSLLCGRLLSLCFAWLKVPPLPWWYSLVCGRLALSRALPGSKCPLSLGGAGYFGTDCALSYGTSSSVQILEGLGYKQNKRGPLIYVYELPPEFHVKWVEIHCPPRAHLGIILSLTTWPTVRTQYTAHPHC